MGTGKDSVLITGGAGFIGLALAARLAGRERVVLFDALLHDPGLQRERAAAVGAELIEGDVCDPDALAQAMRGAGRVVHLASLAGVERVCSAPVDTLSAQLSGGLNLFAACGRTPGLERVVLVSSSEVYGPRADRVDEDATAAPLPVGDPRWVYAAGKLALEHLGLAHHRQHGLPVCVVRPFNVYGPGQLGVGAVRTFGLRALAGEPLEVHNGGQQVRAWCHIDDLVAGLEAVLSAPVAPGRIYNLGNPAAAVSVRELAERIRTAAGSTSPIVDHRRPGAEVQIRIPDIARARRELGFEPTVGLDAGLASTLDWLGRQPGEAS